MMTIKKVWLTEIANGLFTMTLETESPSPDVAKIVTRTFRFPIEPSPEHPLRETTSVGLFDDEDLLMISDALADHLFNPRKNKDD